MLKEVRIGLYVCFACFKLLYASNNKNILVTMSLILGVDLGTTSVKVAVIDGKSQKVLNVQSENTNADIVSSTSALGSEQSHSQIFKACIACLQRLEATQRSQIVRIAVSGQMHGIILWKSNIITENVKDNYLNLTSHDTNDISPLYTWQDARCSDDFLATLPQPNSHLHIATGHGCATLFWLKMNIPGFLDGSSSSSTSVAGFDCAGTIMDLLTTMLCGLKKPIMSIQNAASWGFYDTVENQWNKQILKDADFPVDLLPDVIHPGAKLGEVKTSWLGIPRGTDVGVAMGDLQCSVLPHLICDTQAVINIGTSMQAVFKCPPDFTPTRSRVPSSLAYFPFFKGKYLTVAASLNGGNVLTSTVKMLKDIMELIEIPEKYIKEEKIFEMLMEKGKYVEDTGLVINPIIHGERHSPNEKGSIKNITPFNMDVGHFARALCHGLIANLVAMLPREKLCTDGVTRIVGCGNALLRNKLLQEELRKAYAMPIEVAADSNAAIGGAIALIQFWDDS